MTALTSIASLHTPQTEAEQLLLPRQGILFPTVEPFDRTWPGIIYFYYEKTIERYERLRLRLPSLDPLSG